MNAKCDILCEKDTFEVPLKSEKGSAFVERNLEFARKLEAFKMKDETIGQGKSVSDS